jgi:hypothetical protein
MYKIFAAGMFVVFANISFAADNWQISEDSLGPIKIGMKIEEAEKAANKKFNLNPYGVKYSDKEECLYVIFDDSAKDLFFMVNQGVIVRIDVETPKTITDFGVNIGTKLQKVKELYKGEVASFPEKYSGLEQLELSKKDKPNYKMIIDSDEKGDVTHIRNGRVPEVEYVESCS